MKKRLFGILLSFALMLTMMPALGLDQAAYAGDPKAYAAYDVTTTANRDKSGEALTALQVKFNEKSWYIIEDNSTAVDAGTVTLLAAESFGNSEFDNSSSQYSTSTIKDTLDSMTASGGPFADVASAINTVKVKGSESDTEVDAKLYLLNTTEASNVPENVRKFSTNWWLRSPGSFGDWAALVEYSHGSVDDVGELVTNLFGVRPALQLDLSKVVFDTTSKKFSIQPYPLWVGGTQVTSANASDIPAKDGDTRTGKASYTPASDGNPAKLKLENYSYEGTGVSNYGSAITTFDDLTIELTGMNTITHTPSGGYSAAIYASNLTITGSGKLIANAGGNTSNTMSYGIDAYQLTIDANATVIANGGKSNGENAESFGINAKGVTVNGTLEANGDLATANSVGVRLYYGTSVEVKSGSTVAAVGNNRAIAGNVKNAIAGTGWENADGSGEKTDIAVDTSDEGQSLTFKKVQFPAMFTVTFTDGQGKTLKTEKVASGKAATAPDDPTRDGYTFKGWDKDFSKITEDMTVTALWEKKTDPTPPTPTPEPDPTPTPQPESKAKPVSVVKGIAKGKTSLKFTWNKVEGAAKYELWMSKCNTAKKKYTVKRVKRLGADKTTYTRKELRPNTAYKFRVVAKDASGNVICKSVTSHAYTGNVRGKYTNAKSLKVKKSSFTLNKGGTAKIKATQKKAGKGKKLCNHAKLLRYKSNNTSVAKVSSSGKITAVGSGTCTVYVQTVNGIWKTVKVTVK